MMKKLSFLSKFFLTVLILFYSFNLLLAQQNLNINDVSGFSDSKHHWMDITDHEQVIVPSKNQESYMPANVREIANNILLYQQPNGGWPKNYDMLAILNDEQESILAVHKDSNRTTFDNGATYTQIEYLAKAYSILKDERYKYAALKGIHYILKAQYDNGGWPQFYPDLGGYRRYITFNDDAMIGVITVFQHIVQGTSYYEFVDDALRTQATKAYEKGIDCILDCQIRENDKLTVWCQQHDNATLKPVGARTFELPSKASGESAEIVELLMQVQHPDKKIINSINAAVDWFKKVAIKDTRVKSIPAKHVVYKYHVANDDRIVVTDSSAPLIWTRFYELGTDKPMFANRDGQKVYSLAEVSRERRTGYGWYGYWPAKLINVEYPEWLERNKLN